MKDVTVHLLYNFRFARHTQAYFPPARGPLLLFSFCCLLRFSQWDLRQFSFFPVPVDFTPLFFSNSALYGKAGMIFREPDLEDLALLVPCFELEGSGLRPAALTILPVEAVPVAEVDDAGS